VEFMSLEMVLRWFYDTGTQPSLGDANCLTHWGLNPDRSTASASAAYSFFKDGAKATLYVSNLFTRVGEIPYYSSGFEFLGVEFLGIEYAIDLVAVLRQRNLHVVHQPLAICITNPTSILATKRRVDSKVEKEPERGIPPARQGCSFLRRRHIRLKGRWVGTQRRLGRVSLRSLRSRRPLLENGVASSGHPGGTGFICSAGSALFQRRIAAGVSRSRYVGR
jgi:hypothetical protein